jgi:hypothetical protein
MSFVSTITDAVGITSTSKAPATVEKINQQIANTTASIKQLERDHARACLDWADDPGSNRAVRDKISADLHAARIDLASLNSALTMARERNGQEERRRLAALNASRLHSMTMHLRSLERASAEVSAALAKAAEGRRKMLAAAAKARASAPSPLPRGSSTEANVIDALIANEMHRVSWDAKHGGLPGAKAPTLSVKEKPEAIAPLQDQLRQAADWSINVVKGEISVERTPPAVAQIASDNAKLEAVADAVIGPAPADFDPADLQPGTKTATEIMAAMPKVSLSLTDK